MNKVILLDHNEIAYKKLIKCLENNKLVAINHATGTGKSFIILKYLEEHKDKRILYLAPTYLIIDQLLNEHMQELEIDKNSFNKLDYNIYANLKKYDMKQLVNDYDVIILDEYHRCGAKKWGKLVNQLLNHVKNSNEDKKVIGTTATEIRYLDNEKNMNDILFDGVTASTLTLADAILQGILPVFEYVTSSHCLIEEIAKLEKKIDLISVYPDLKQKYYNVVRELRNEAEKNIVNEKKYRDFFQKGNKYLVFSSTIDKIEKDKQIIANILKDCKYQEYVITSRLKRDKIRKIITEFRNKINNNVSKILYSVDLLIEGVHVKDVDAIFMLRKTMSPRVYFQILGRLLSCSKNKKRVVVFDLENNIRNHKVIYTLYNEIITRAKELMITDPKNYERYKYIIENFKILDNVSNIYTKIDKLKEELSKSNLIGYRLNEAISILSNETDNEYLKMQAYADIFKYQNYITVEQFKKIVKLDIVKPSLFDLSVEEFITYLDGNINIADKKTINTKKIYEKILEFYEINYSLPSVLSTDADERNLALELIKTFELMSEKYKEEIKACVNDDLSLIEKIVYGIVPKISNYEQLYKEIDAYINLKVPIDVNIITILQYSKDPKSKSYIDKIRKNNTYTLQLELQSIKAGNIINDDRDRKTLEENINIPINILFSQELGEFAEQFNDEYNNSENKYEYIEQLSNEIIEFIKVNLKMPSFTNEGKNLYLKKIFFNKKLEDGGFILKIEKVYEIVKSEIVEEKRRRNYARILDFMSQNNGKMPIVESKDKVEKELAREYLKMAETLNDEERQQISNLQDRNKSFRAEVVKKYITFVKQKRRRPSDKSKNEYEQNLAREFLSIKSALTLEEQLVIQQATERLNEYNEVRTLYREMLEKRMKEGRK